MKNPYLNAVAASAYIVAIVSLMQTFSFLGQKTAGEDNILMPIVMLSLVVLSVTVMGYLFGMRPLRMYLDGQKGEAVAFFGKTVGTFAAITVVALVAMIVYTLYR